MATETLVRLKPIDANPKLKDTVYQSLKDAISDMDIYSGQEPPKLDERKLADDLGVSRTPIREAITRLEQEGLVVTYPRRGAFVVRKSKQEILEIICVWAALEGMAARLVTEKASNEEIASMRKLFATFDDSNEARAHIDEYSETNIEFHQRLIELSKCKLLKEIADSLFMHMRAIRRKTIGERDRAAESIIDHMRIIQSLEDRDATMAEQLVREHAMYLANHIKQHVDYLD
ncbi:MAG: GntR family transcriptional regulator [Gammaproteobacteria bacterium]|jgi:DNA-binding GntR family transcriptional regulator